MATFTEMKNSVFAVLRDSERAFVQEEEVGEWLNEAYLDIAARARITKKAATGTLSGTGTLTLPSDFIELTNFSVETDVTGVFFQPEFTSDDIFLSYKNAGVDPAYTLARIFNGTIETYPVCASKAYSLEYVYKPTALVNGTDTPTLPQELHVKMIHYARSHAKFKEGELEEGDRYMALYVENLPMMPSAGMRERPGPLDLVLEPGWYDEWTG